MYLSTYSVEECCGCAACEQICPRDCIRMKTDTEGFRVPEVVDASRCIHCGKCEKVCPMVNSIVKKHQAEACYYGWHNDPTSRERSTSGAAFAAIAQACFDRGYHYVFGAAYSQDNNVCHIGISEPKELDKLLCSKYVQSCTEKSFRQVKEITERGGKVVFSGTPCQVQALLNFLPLRLHTQVITVALICHGVASPAALKQYLNCREKELGSAVIEIKFRDKRIVNGLSTQKCTTLRLLDGREIYETENAYTAAFGKGLFTRESCFVCPFTTTERSADISVGDFWGIERYVSGIEEEIPKGISLLLTHSEKGKQLLDALSEYMELHDVPVEQGANDLQQQLHHPSWRYPGRTTFMDSFLKAPSTKKIEKELKKYDRSFFRYRIRRKLWLIINKNGV